MDNLVTGNSRRVQASTFGKQLINQPSKRFAQDLLSVPLPFAAFNLLSDQATWRKAAKFTSTKISAISATVKSSTGYAIIMNYDGTYGATGTTTPSAVSKVGTGDSAADITVTGRVPATPFNKTLPKFYAIYPCDSAGNLSGDLTYISIGISGITSFDGTGLSALTTLILFRNQLTSIDLTGLSALTTLKLNENLLTSIDLTGLSALDNLNLSTNLLTSIDLTGFSALTTLSIYSNLLTSIDLTGLSALDSLGIGGNLLTSLDLTGVSALDTLQLGNNQLSSVLIPGFTGTQPYTSTISPLELYNQQMTTDAVWAMLDSISAPAVDQPYPIELSGNPCDDEPSGGPNLVEDGVHTQAEIEALLTAKGYSLQLTHGTLAP